MSFREEFRLKKIGFSGISLDRFYISQWNVPGVVYLIYRIIVAAYTVAILAVTASHHVHNIDHPWAIYLTNWTYTVLTLYFVFHAFVVIGGYLVCQNEGRKLGTSLRPEVHAGLFHEIREGRDTGGQAEPERQPLLTGGTRDHDGCSPWYLKVTWILFNVSSTGSVMVTLVFWAVLVPLAGGSGLAAVNHDNVQLHLVNSVLVLIELSTTALPVRIMHVIYPFVYGLIYMIFSLIYWADDHSHVIYDILDWGKPGITTGCILVIGFVIIPLLQLLLYLLYRLRIKVYQAMIG